MNDEVMVADLCSYMKTIEINTYFEEHKTLLISFKFQLLIFLSSIFSENIEV